MMPQLHWLQNSVFAGELTKTAAEDLYRRLEENTKSARVTFWMFDRVPEVRQIGAQEDRESIFL
ncbi:MAG: CRISPR-associated endonuclease Cas2 [Methanobacteriota archaeon]